MSGDQQLPLGHGRAQVEPRGPELIGAATDGLLSAAGRGDLNALAALYDQTAPVVFGLLHGIFGEAGRAEQATERVYLQVWRTAPRYDDREGSAFSLLLRTARRELVGQIGELISEGSSGAPASEAAEHDGHHADPHEQCG